MLPSFLRSDATVCTAKPASSAVCSIPITSTGCGLTSTKTACPSASNARVARSNSTVWRRLRYQYSAFSSPVSRTEPVTVE